MKLREIHQIELTNRCNLKCIYCPNHKMQRKRQDMSITTFERTLQAVRRFVDIGTQKEVWLHGLGESLLHPQLDQYCRLARKYLPDTQIKLSTNGILVTEDLARMFSELGIAIHVSVQLSMTPEQIRKMVEVPIMLAEFGVLEYINTNAIISSGDWAGQVDWPNIVQPSECGWLKYGWSVVLSDGRIATCCNDVDGDSVVGSVHQPINEILDLEMVPHKLCGPCYQYPPGEQP
jgi:hypothetical protein